MKKVPQKYEKGMEQQLNDIHPPHIIRHEADAVGVNVCVNQTLRIICGNEGNEGTNKFIPILVNQYIIIKFARYQM